MLSPNSNIHLRNVSFEIFNIDVPVNNSASHNYYADNASFIRSPTILSSRLYGEPPQGALGSVTFF